jgi:hypothetical protein
MLQEVGPAEFWTYQESCDFDGVFNWAEGKIASYLCNRRLTPVVLDLPGVIIVQHDLYTTESGEH